MKVLIVSADDPFCQSAQALLGNTDGISAIDETRGGSELIGLICEQQPDLILLDLDSLGWDAPEIVAQLGTRCPNGKTIIVSAAGKEEMVLAAFRKGARGHLVKGVSSPDQIIEAVRAVARGESILSPTMAGAILDEMSHRYRLGRAAFPAP